MEWAQILMLMVVLWMLGDAFSTHGERRTGRYSMWGGLCRTFTLFGLLMWGGFWR